jgi:signal transduction histidine kinase
MHPAIVSTGGLVPALKSLAGRSPIPIALEVAVPRRLPEVVEVAAYYVVAEALTNAAKYAQACELAVTADADEEVLQLTVRDDGVGGATAGKGSGLIGLIDRVEALGGQLVISSPVGGGTSLRANLPLRHE